MKVNAIRSRENSNCPTIIPLIAAASLALASPSLAALPPGFKSPSRSSSLLYEQQLEKAIQTRQSNESNNVREEDEVTASAPATNQIPEVSAPVTAPVLVAPSSTETLEVKTPEVVEPQAAPVAVVVPETIQEAPVVQEVIPEAPVVLEAAPVLVPPIIVDNSEPVVLAPAASTEPTLTPPVPVVVDSALPSSSLPRSEASAGTPGASNAQALIAGGIVVVLAVAGLAAAGNSPQEVSQPAATPPAPPTSEPVSSSTAGSAPLETTEASAPNQ